METRFMEMIFPDRTNHYGTLFAGHALQMMAKAALVAASRYARRDMVAVSTERIQFKAPVRHGHLAELTARVTSTRPASLLVQVELVAEELKTGNRELSASGEFLMAALDDSGKLTRIEPAPDETGTTSLEETPQLP